MSGFRKVEAKRLYESVVEQVFGLVASGELHPGERLPPERDLGAYAEGLKASELAATKRKL